MTTGLGHTITLPHMILKHQLSSSTHTKYVTAQYPNDLTLLSQIKNWGKYSTEKSKIESIGGAGPNRFRQLVL